MGSRSARATVYPLSYAILNPSADPQSRQFGIRIRLDNPGEILKPGMFAKIALITQSVDTKTSVPTEAINKDDSGATTVTIVDKDTIDYEGTFDDPKVFTRPFKMKFELKKSAHPEEPFESDCFGGERDQEHIVNGLANIKDHYYSK